MALNAWTQPTRSGSAAPRVASAARKASCQRFRQERCRGAAVPPNSQTRPARRTAPRPSTKFALGSRNPTMPTGPATHERSGCTASAMRKAGQGLAKLGRNTPNVKPRKGGKPGTPSISQACGRRRRPASAEAESRAATPAMPSVTPTEGRSPRPTARRRRAQRHRRRRAPAGVSARGGPCQAARRRVPREQRERHGRGGCRKERLHGVERGFEEMSSR